MVNKHILTSSIILILANIVPVLGVFFLGWDAFSILIFYWIESLFVGIFTVFKIRKAEGKMEMNVIINNKRAKDMDKNELTFNFIRFYGIFMAVHIFFLIIFFFMFFKDSSFSLFSVLLPSLSLLISHGMSYKTNFIGNEEFKKFSSSYMFYMPFKRIFIMQFILILGIGFFIFAFRLTPSVVIIPIVAFKTIFDLIFHWAEHSGKAKSAPLRFSG
jgi:hypothetical protein